MKRQLDDAENPNNEEEQNVKKLRTIESENCDQTKLEDTPEGDVPVEKRSVELSAENLIDGARTDEPEKAIEQPEKEEQQLEKEEPEKPEKEKPEKEEPEKEEPEKEEPEKEEPEKEEPEKEGLPERAEHQLPEKEPPAEKASENQEDSDQEKGIRPLDQEHDEGEGDNSEKDLDDEISAAVEKVEGEEESESEAPAEPLDEKVEAAEEMHDRDGFALQKSHVVPSSTEAQQHAPIPAPGPRAPPILSHTRVKCQDCGSLISVCRRAGDSIVLLKCPVCCSYVAFDHLHSPTIIPYQERTDNFSCHTWNPTQLMVFLQQMGLGHILPYLAHHNIDGRAMMELFRGELRQRVGLQTEEQTQSLLTALNILRLGEGIA